MTAAQYTVAYSYDTLGRLASGPLGSYSYGDTAHKHAATAIGASYTEVYPKRWTACQSVDVNEAKGVTHYAATP